MLSPPRSALPASVPRVAAAALLWAASSERLAARSTTLATATATPTKMTSARAFSGRSIENVWTGGVK